MHYLSVWSCLIHISRHFCTSMNMRTCHQIISSRVIKEEHKKCGWATFAISYGKLYYNTSLMLVFPPQDRVWREDGKQQGEAGLSSPPPNTPGQQSWTSTDRGEAEPGKKLLSFFFLLKQRGSRLYMLPDIILWGANI